MSIALNGHECSHNLHEMHSFGVMLKWCFENFDILSGVSFLPHSNHSYQQAPYEPIDKVLYQKELKAMTTIDLNFEELLDTTTSSQELACAGGACEL